VAQDDGHSVETMLPTYAAWIKGANLEDIEGIKQAIAGHPATDALSQDSGANRPLQSPNLAATWPPEVPNPTVQALVPATPAAVARHATHSFNRESAEYREGKNWLGWQDSNLRMAGSKPEITH
jgi:hypothetical protein